MSKKKNNKGVSALVSPQPPTKALLNTNEGTEIYRFLYELYLDKFNAYLGLAARIHGSVVDCDSKDLRPDDTVLSNDDIPEKKVAITGSDRPLVASEVYVPPHVRMGSSVVSSGFDCRTNFTDPVTGETGLSQSQMSRRQSKRRRDAARKRDAEERQANYQEIMELKKQTAQAHLESAKRYQAVVISREKQALHDEEWKKLRMERETERKKAVSVAPKARTEAFVAATDGGKPPSYVSEPSSGLSSHSSGYLAAVGKARMGLGTEAGSRSASSGGSNVKKKKKKRPSKSAVESFCSRCDFFTRYD